MQASEISRQSLDWRRDGLTSEEAKNRLTRFGPNCLEEEKESPWRRIASCFWGPIPWMIEVAAILSIAVKHWPDFFIIMFLLVANAAIDYWNEHKASSALSALKSQLAMKARALRDGVWGEIEARDLVPDDVIRVRLGDVIPADATLVDGEYLSVDQAALTGESLPVSRKVGDQVYSGSIAKQGEMIARVDKTGAHTFFGKTAKLVEGAGNVSHFQQTVMQIGNFLIVLAVILSIILTSVQLIRGADFLELLQFVLILVIASIPVAMPTVLSVTMALGAVALAKQKAIVSKLQAIEELAGVDVLCSDKTGTLTKNQLSLGDPILFEGSSSEQCVLAGALASKSEDHDAIDLAVIGALDDPSVLQSYEVLEWHPFDPVGKRTEVKVKMPDGSTTYYTKGAPQVILDLCSPNAEQREQSDTTVNHMAQKGFRTLSVASSTDKQNWKLLGILPLFDPPRDDSAETIQNAKELGLSVKMVTGDNLAIGTETSGQLGMGTHLIPAKHAFPEDMDPDHVPSDIGDGIEKADGFAEVFPEHKYAIVKSLQERKHYVGMTGDGVNDAPALKQADVGVAVSGATDAARAAADLILTAPGLSTVIRAIEFSRQIFQRMMSYTIYRVAMTIDIMFFVVLAMIAFNFTPLSALMIVLLTLLDDVPIMAIAYDNAVFGKKPSRFQMRQLFTVASGLGVLSVVQTFGLLAVCWGFMHNAEWQTWFHQHLGSAMTNDHIQSIMFLQLVAGGHFLLFITRTRGLFFSLPLPSWQLSSAILGTQMLAILMCGFGILVPSLPWELIGLVYLYNIAWMFVLDYVKLGIYEYFNMAHRPRRHRKFLHRLNSSLHSHTS
ncbi:MAG: plasma-membrane proton-efflux P-type ATPase [Planctomycetia bacterium]|jgi:H+-transporting ATPase